MFILRSIRFYPIMPFSGKYHIVLSKVLFYGWFFKYSVFFSFPQLMRTKVTAVMAKPVNIRLDIFPCPILTCQFTKRPVFITDIETVIIALKTDGRFMSSANLQRYIDRMIFCYPIWFMCGNNYRNAFQSCIPPFSFSAPVFALSNPGVPKNVPVSTRKAKVDYGI